MKSYDDEILEEAVDFLKENEDDIIQAIMGDKDFDRNEISCLDTFEEFVDPSFSTEDALVILDESHDEGEDYGEQDPEKALVNKAMSAYQNDAWTKTEDLYNQMKEQLDDITPVEGQTVEKTAFDEIVRENTSLAPLPVKKDSKEELDLLREWLSLNDRAGGFWAGCPLGQSYIDARCGSGHRMPDIKDFVDFDHEVREKVPWLAGKYRRDVQARFDELIEKTRITHKMNYTGLNKIEKALPNVIIDYIMTDNRLSISDIREIAGVLQYRAQGWPS